jgi:hypothetical protein
LDYVNASGFDALFIGNIMGYFRDKNNDLRREVSSSNLGPMEITDDHPIQKQDYPYQ